MAIKTTSYLSSKPSYCIISVTAKNLSARPRVSVGPFISVQGVPPLKAFYSHAVIRRGKNYNNNNTLMSQMPKIPDNSLGMIPAQPELQKFGERDLA